MERGRPATCHRRAVRKGGRHVSFTLSGTSTLDAHEKKMIGLNGSSARLTDCVAVFLRVFGVFWTTCRRALTKRIVARYLGSMRRNENTRNVSSDASPSPFALSVSKNLRRSLRFASTRRRAPHLTQIGGQWIQKKRCCLHVLRSLSSSMLPAPKLFNLPTSLSKNT